MPCLRDGKQYVTGMLRNCIIHMHTGIQHPPKNRWPTFPPTAIQLQMNLRDRHCCF